jgi:hypothetical protein
MATTINSSDLNFDDIKTSLKTYFAQKSEFADYDFEGSGLSNILDVLAYNTHLNGLIANFALNEAFLPTAQLRTSLVNHSLSFGYIPRSKTASTAQLTVTVDLGAGSGKPSSITMPAGTQFTATVDGTQYTFRTLVEHTAYPNPLQPNLYTFVDALGDPYIRVFEGELIVKTFIAEITGDRQVYVVPDENLDLSTVGVQVYDNINSDNFTSYFSANATSGGNAITSVTADTALYLPLETYNGYWEFNFGVLGITGKNPVNGEVIRITYLRTNGLSANGASSFSPVSTLAVSGFGNRTLNTIVRKGTKSAFGADKESLESIRTNAPLSYLAQNRLVAAGDYRGVIANGVPGIKSINAWGGEDNIPAKYGKTIISIVYESDVNAIQKAALQTLIKSNLTDPLSIVGVEAEFVEPTFIYLDLVTNFRYNESLTNLTRNALQGKIQNTVSSYFAANSGKFNATIRKSKLEAQVDAADPSILGSNIDIKMSAKFTPLVNPDSGSFVRTDYTINFINAIESPLMTVPSITSDRFVVNGVSCTVRNAPLHSTTLQAVDRQGNVVISSIGNYEPTTGKVNLVGFLPESIASGNSYLTITATAADDSVFKPLRNTLISIGTNTAVATSDTNDATAVVGVTN